MAGSYYLHSFVAENTFDEYCENWDMKPPLLVYLV